MTDTHFCCSILEDHIFSAGRKGFSIIPVYFPELRESYIFFLQSRNLDASEIEFNHTIIDQAINFCPWCGTKLSEIVSEKKDFIQEIATKNRHLIKI